MKKIKLKGIMPGFGPIKTKSKNLTGVITGFGTGNHKYGGTIIIDDFLHDTPEEKQLKDKADDYFVKILKERQAEILIKNDE